MSNFKNLRFSTKILFLVIGSVLFTILALVATVVWQSAQFNALAQEQFARAAEADLGHIAGGAYNTIEAQDQVVLEQANAGLRVAQQLIHDAGEVKLAEETIDWQATNEITQQTTNIQLPKMDVGNTWLGKFTGRYDTTPIVDHEQLIAGGNATIFQRMNEKGDMLRVATNVLLPNGQRAVGTYVPAINPDGTPNPAVAAALRNAVYRGSDFIVDAWYNAAYAPIRDESGQVIGMLQVAMNHENVDAARQAILRTKVGATGNVEVLGSDGNAQGRYIISRNGQRDGERVWETQSADGSFPIQSMIEKAVALKFGNVAIEHYQWQDPGDPAPRSKVAGVTYYEPWHWVIVASMDESEIQAYQRTLEEGQMRMIVAASAVGVALALIAGFLSVLVARSIARPVIHLADVATQVSGGNLQAVAIVEERDEIGTLATAFNTMTSQLRTLVGDLEERVEARTEQMRASADVGRTAAAALDPDELLNRVVNLITERFGFYYTAVFTKDNQNRYAILREATGEAGRLLKAQGHQLEIGGRSMVGQAMARRQPRIAQDTGEEAVRFANPLLPDTRSEIALPLVAGEQVLGALDVQSTSEAAFDESSAAVLQSMADQIAVALSNAEQFKQANAALQRAENLSESILTMVDAKSIQEVVQLLARYANSMVAANRTAVYLVDHDLKQVSAQAVAGDNYDPETLRYEDLNSGISGLVFRSGQPVLSLSADDGIEPAETAERRRQNGTGALIVAPLVAQGQVIGTVTASNLVGQRLFTRQDVDLFMTLAAQSVSVIERLHLFEQAQRALSDLDTINRQLTGAGWEKFARRRSQSNYIWVTRSDQLQPSGVVGPSGAVGPQPLSEVTEALALGHIATRLLDDGEQLGVAVPIKLRDVPIGTLRLIVPLQSWTAELSASLESIAGHVAQAAENARLIAASEERLARERALTEATEKVRQRNEIDSILETAAGELARYLNVNRIAVRLSPAAGPSSEIEPAV